MNPAATEYYPSMNFHFQQPFDDYTPFLFRYLDTNYQMQNVQSILHEWATLPTSSTLIQNWSTPHTRKSTHSPFFSF